MPRRSTLGDLASLLREGSRLVKSVRDLSQEPEIREIFSFLRNMRKQYDPFAELGVDPDASKEEVDAVYLAKMKFAHPDAGGSNEKATKLNKARDEIYKLKGWRQG